MADRHGHGVELTAAICTYQRYEYLGKAIDSLLDQTRDADDYEILILDNTPDCEQRAEWAARYQDHPRVRYMTLDRPGLANARNVAAEEARGEILAFLDDDAVADREWVDSYINGFREGGPEAQIAGGPVRPIFEVPRPAWLHDELLTFFTVIDWGDKERFLQPSEWVAGANIAYRTAAYRLAGGCNVTLGRIGAGGALLSNEETDLSERIHASGGKTRYLPQAGVDHLVPASRLTREWLRRRIIWQAISDKIAGKPDYGTREQMENWLLEYIAAVPPEHRSFRAFFYDAEDPKLFQWQVQSLYNLYALTAGQGVLFTDREL